MLYVDSGEEVSCVVFDCGFGLVGVSSGGGVKYWFGVECGECCGCGFYYFIGGCC